MATIACKCGKCHISLSTTAPRVQTVCCCADCYNRFNVLHKQKDGPSPQNHNLPAILYSYENSMRIESGDIYFYKLDVNNDRPVNVASTCCNTYMLGFYAPYHHNCVVVPSSETSGGGKIINADLSSIKPNFISFRNGKEQFNDLLDRQPYLNDTPEFWFKGDTVESGFDGTGEWEKSLGDTTAKLQKEIVGLEGGKSFDELLEERGGKDSIVILKVV